jgi:hypothetical protein
LSKRLDTTYNGFDGENGLLDCIPSGKRPLIKVRFLALRTMLSNKVSDGAALEKGRIWF